MRLPWLFRLAMIDIPGHGSPAPEKPDAPGTESFPNPELRVRTPGSAGGRGVPEVDTSRGVEGRLDGEQFDVAIGER